MVFATTSPQLLLDLVSEVASRFAAPGDIVVKTSDVLQLMQRALGAHECSLWLVTPRGPVQVACAGESGATADELAPLIEIAEASHPQLAIHRLVQGNRLLGLLVVRGEVTDAPDRVAALRAIGSMLAPELLRAEQSRAAATDADVARRFGEQIIDALPLGLYVIDREYRVKAWNRKRESGMQGISRERALGKTIFEILHRAPAEKLRMEFDEVFRSGRTQQFDLESKIAGETRTYRISKIPMRLQEGGPVSHVITIGEDITDWTTARDRFVQSEKYAAVGQLASGVLHEVDAPLAEIARAAERISASLGGLDAAGIDVSKPQTELVAVEASVSRCRAIVEGLVQLSRVGQRGEGRRDVDLNQVVEQGLFLVQHHERFRSLQIDQTLSPVVGSVFANPDQLSQVLMALLSNAADASQPGGRVTIRTRPADAPYAALLEVIDEGCGISAENMSKIFEPFFTTKPPGTATGLGLTISHSIVAEHGGRLEVDSAVGAGSTFRIYLPAAEAL